MGGKQGMAKQEGTFKKGCVFVWIGYRSDGAEEERRKRKGNRRIQHAPVETKTKKIQGSIYSRPKGVTSVTEKCWSAV